MAPEIFKGNRYDSKVDVWAVGVSFYMLVYNKTPFKNDN